MIQEITTFMTNPENRDTMTMVYVAIGLWLASLACVFDSSVNRSRANQHQNNMKTIKRFLLIIQREIMHINNFAETCVDFDLGTDPKARLKKFRYQSNQISNVQDRIDSLK